MVLFKRFGMGTAPSELQEKVANVLLSLLEDDTPPCVSAFYGEGAKLACENSPASERLRRPSIRRERLVSCQTCLDYSGPRNQIRVGVIGGMGDIVAAMNDAEKAISV
jgi:hypothetical protein